MEVLSAIAAVTQLATQLTSCVNIVSSARSSKLTLQGYEEDMNELRTFLTGIMETPSYPSHIRQKAERIFNTTKTTDFKKILKRGSFKRALFLAKNKKQWSRDFTALESRKSTLALSLQHHLGALPAQTKTREKPVHRTAAELLEPRRPMAIIGSNCPNVFINQEVTGGGNMIIGARAGAGHVAHNELVTGGSTFHKTAEAVGQVVKGAGKMVLGQEIAAGGFVQPICGTYSGCKVEGSGDMVCGYDFLAKS